MLPAGMPAEVTGWYVMAFPLPLGMYANGVASMEVPFQTRVTFIGVVQLFVTNAAKQFPAAPPLLYVVLQASEGIA